MNFGCVYSFAWVATVTLASVMVNATYHESALPFARANSARDNVEVSFPPAKPLVLTRADSAEKTAPKTVEKEKAPRFTLMDSNDKPFALSFPREKPVVITVGDQGAQGQTDRWRKPLEKRYGERVENCAVAWLEEIPSFMRGAVTKIIQTTYDWVLLDWNGAAAKRYRCKANSANIFVLSTDGYILFEAHGDMKKKRMDELVEILDAALEKTE